MFSQTVSEHQGEAGKCIVRINLFRDHRQTIQYILPTDHHKLAQVRKADNKIEKWIFFINAQTKYYFL